MSAEFLLIKGMISTLPLDAQARVAEAEKKIRAIIAEDEGIGMMALALVGADLKEKK